MKFTAILALLFLPFTVQPALAAGPTNWSSRTGCVKTITVNGTTYNDVASVQGFECLFYNILQVIVYFAGIAFLFMFISGGFKYLFSGNEQKSVAAAGSTLTMAFIGLVGIIASWLILSFIQKFTGVNVTQFKIPGLQ